MHSRVLRSILVPTIIAVTACSTEVAGPDINGTAARYDKGGAEITVTVSPSSSSLIQGSTLQLTAQVSTEKTLQDARTLTWTSSNQSIATISPAGVVTAIAVGGPVVISASTGGKKSVVGSAMITVFPRTPTWSTLVDQGTAPAAPIYESTNAPTDQALYAILGNGDFQVFSLWRFDLTTDTWSEIPTSDFPNGKFRRIVHDPLTHRILTYWDGRGQVYSVPETGGSWQPVGATPNSDEWYGAAPFLNPQTGRLSVFGGYGFFTWKNSLVSFVEGTATWSEDTQSATRPEPRFAMTMATDEDGKAFFVNSGQGSASGSQFDDARVFNDLWRLDLQTNTWANVIADDGAANPTIGAGMDFVPSRNSLYRFGGSHGAGNPNYLSILESVDLGASVPAWTVVATTGSAPSPRNSAGLYYDAPRNRLLVVGGYQLDGAVKLDVYSLALQ